MGERSSAMVTLLFTDLVASTELLARLGDDAAEEVRRAHFSLLRQAIAETGGEEVKSLGDGLMVVFGSAVDALRCAVAIQRAVERHNAAGAGPELALRVGVHAGEPLRDGADFHGESVVTASRLCNEADGGQILASELVAGLVGSRGGFRFRPAGRVPLKGLPEPVAAVTVDWRSSKRSPAGIVPTARLAAGPGTTSPAPIAHEGATPGPRGPRLVGRERELAVLEREFAIAAGGEFRCALLVGDAGVGKTRLARELVTRQLPAVVTLSARAYPLGATTAFGVWIEALERHLRGLDADEVEWACAGVADDLAGLLRSVRAARAPRSAPVDEHRSRLLEAFTVVLSNLARERPLVMLLDDVHLADASSLELLHYLAHGCAGESMLVLATARPAELTERRDATMVLSRLEQDDILRRLPVEPLPADALARLAEEVTGEPAPPVLVGWVEQRSRGNPLYAIGLLRALVEEQADLSAPVLRRLPEGLAERVTGRLRELDEAAQRTMELLAVVGRRVDSRSLVGLSGENADELTDTLDRLVQFRGVTEEEQGHELTYEISHPLVAEAIYQGISAGRRRRLHREVGRRLLAAGRLGEAAPHFVAAADPGDDEAVGVLRDAVAAAEKVESYQEALTILNALVELLPAGDHRWVDVVDALSWEAQWVVNHRADTHAILGIPALRAMDQALAGVGDPARRAAVKFRLASFLGWGAGELDEARRVGGEAELLFEAAGDRRGALLARHEMAWVYLLSGGPEACRRAEELATGVAHDAEAAGDDPVRSRAMGTLAGAMVARCKLAESDEFLARALDDERAGDRPHGRYSAHYYRALALAAQGKAGEAKAALAAADMFAIGFDAGPRLQLQFIVAGLVGDHRWTLDQARERNLIATELSRHRALAFAVAGMAAVEVGELDDARRYVSRARSAYGESSWGFQSEFARYAEAALAWREAGPSAAVPTLREAVARLMTMDAWTAAIPPLVDLAELGGRLGRPEATAAEGLAAVAERSDMDCHRALLALASGWAAFAGSDRPAAAADAARAVEVLSALDWPFYLGRAWALLGLTTADRDQAVGALRSAAGIFDTTGSLARRAEVLDALGRLGSAGKRAAAVASGPASLTSREREVAALAAAGLSANEIGERLFIGKRTVESHLARAYAKLGVRSKVDLVRRGPELGL
ncbi:MAG TPA: AAA family ATPase [Acidimicrobiia bacterium]|nr:AAA family ATPase [Acidimicrobiia bacterium]